MNGILYTVWKFWLTIKHSDALMKIAMFKMFGCWRYISRAITQMLYSITEPFKNNNLFL